MEALKVCLKPGRRKVDLEPLLMLDLPRWVWAGAGVRRQTVLEERSWLEGGWTGSWWLLWLQLVASTLHQEPGKTC